MDWLNPFLSEGQDYFILLDDDLILTNATFSKLLLSMNDNVSFINASVLDADNERGYEDYIDKQISTDDLKHIDGFKKIMGMSNIGNNVFFHYTDSKLIPATHLNGACCMINKEHYDKVGGHSFYKEIPNEGEDTVLGNLLNKVKQGFTHTGARAFHLPCVKQRWSSREDLINLYMKTRDLK